MRWRNEVSEVERSGGVDGLTALLANPAIQKLRAALESRRAVTVAAEEGVRRAAVALIFRAGERGSPELLFIKRAEYPGDPWSGQIAFPGGREEASDTSLAETAIRETREETGIDLVRDGQIIGTLDDLRPRTVRLPAVLVRPYVVLLDHAAPLALSAEIALAFWIPFGSLTHTESWREDTVFARGIQINARVFRHQDHLIWGMTERILAQLMALLE
ncbi:MAG: CoA pyrophosphatase [Gemmatimonadetes bacterium]|nr:MAG: CoA pyrophosphatase [Gemmatimonadota bacterium]